MMTESSSLGRSASAQNLERSVAISENSSDNVVMVTLQELQGLSKRVLVNRIAKETCRRMLELRNQGMTHDAAREAVLVQTRAVQTEDQVVKYLNGEVMA